MNQDQLLAQIGEKSATTARTLHKITSMQGTPTHELAFAWLMATGMGDYTFHPVKDAETQQVITKALEDGKIVPSGEYNYDYATHTSGEKLVLSTL